MDSAVIAFQKSRSSGNTGNDGHFGPQVIAFQKSRSSGNTQAVCPTQERVIAFQKSRSSGNKASVCPKRKCVIAFQKSGSSFGNARRSTFTGRIACPGRPTRSTCTIRLRKRQLSPAGRAWRPRSDSSRLPTAAHSISKILSRPITAPEKPLGITHQPVWETLLSARPGFFTQPRYHSLRNRHRFLAFRK